MNSTTLLEGDEVLLMQRRKKRRGNKSAERSGGEGSLVLVRYRTGWRCDCGWGSSALPAIMIVVKFRGAAWQSGSFASLRMTNLSGGRSFACLKMTSLS